MARGSHPRSLESRRAGGEPATNVPILVAGRPEPAELERAPAGLDRYARAAWHEVVPELVAAQLIDRVDKQAVEAYCVAVGRARALREAIEWQHDERGLRVRRRTLEEQLIAPTVRGTTSNPLLSQERESWREARMMGELLGLNPVGRTRISGRKPQGQGLRGLMAELPRPVILQAVEGGQGEYQVPPEGEPEQ